MCRRSVKPLITQVNAAAAGFALAVAALLTPASAQDAPAPIRDVTPPGILPGPAVTGPLVRIPGPPEPDPKPVERWQRFFLAEVVDAGTLVAGEHTIRIAGVLAPRPDALCPSTDGDWPCGRMARHGLRLMLRGRAVECQIDASAASVEAPCRVGQTDIAEWLVANGWAQPEAGVNEALLAAEDAARCAQRGIWRDRGTDGCPETAP